MNKLLLVIALVAIALPLHISAQDTAKAGQLLSHYYALKDALVSGKPDQASSHAQAFQKAAGTVDFTAANENNLNTLVKAAEKISETKDLKKQREYFASLSTNLVTLASSVKLTDQPLYVAYCPMKKASWLTSEKAIKNPYYGSSMLTCGEITKTIK